MNGTINVWKLNDMGKTDSEEIAHLAIYFSIVPILIESTQAYEMTMLSVFSPLNF
jgi:hypothetical protein